MTRPNMFIPRSIAVFTSGDVINLPRILLMQLTITTLICGWILESSSTNTVNCVQCVNDVGCPKICSNRTFEAEKILLPQKVEKN
jgi:hypothetical protein